MTTTQETLVASYVRDAINDVLRSHMGVRPIVTVEQAVAAATTAILSLTTPPIDDTDKPISIGAAESNPPCSPVSDFDDITYAGGAVPEGWRLVPVEPTEAMLDAVGYGLTEMQAAKAWSAMLKSSPDYKGGDQ